MEVGRIKKIQIFRQVPMVLSGSGKFTNHTFPIGDNEYILLSCRRGLERGIVLKSN